MDPTTKANLEYLEKLGGHLDRIGRGKLAHKQILQRLAILETKVAEIEAYLNGDDEAEAAAENQWLNDALASTKEW